MRKLLAGLAIGLGASVAAVAIGRSAFLETIELKTYDWRMRATARPETARRDIVLVEIDERSLSALEPNAGRWPWPRVIYAGVIDFLAAAGARAIALDVLFVEQDTRNGFRYGDSEWSGEDSDRELVASTRRAGNVVHLGEAAFGTASDTSGPVDWSGRLAFGPEDGPWRVEERPSFRPPFPALAKAGASVGHNFLEFDRDGPARRYAPFIQSRGGVAASLGLAAVMVAEKIRPEEIKIERDAIVLRNRSIPVLRGRAATFGGDVGAETVRSLISFRGPAFLEDGRSRPYQSYPFQDVYYAWEQQIAGQTPTLDPALFRDKIVFIGASAAGLFDVFQTPFERGRMPGIQLHASVADDWLSGRAIRPAGGGFGLLATIAAAVATGVAFSALRLRYALLAAGLYLAIFVFSSLRMFSNGVWLTAAEPFVALVLGAFGGVGYQYLIEGREKRRVKGLFGRYVSKDVYEQLLSDPSLAELGGRRRQMTVLFSDIRGFTTLSEHGEPEAIVGQLNEYFTRMVDIVFRHRGTLDKFVGDMVMALFGAPLDDEEHADHAVSAALDMVAELRALNDTWAAGGRPSLDIGIGINTGDMIAGNIGSRAIMSYTVIGDAVNLGSRLESLNKQYGTRIIISDATRARLRRDYPLRPLGDVVVKGKTKPVAIFEVQA